MPKKKDSKKEKLKALKKANAEIKKERTVKSNQKKWKKVLAISGGSIAAVLIIGYVAGGFYFQNRFYPGTIINGQECGGKDIEYMKDIIKKSAENYSLTVKEKNDQSEVISGNAIKMSYKESNGLEKVAARQDSWLWPLKIFGEKEYTVKAENFYDEESLNLAMDSLACLQDANMTPSQDAKIQDNGTSYEIVPEVIGTALDKEKTKEMIKKAVEERKTEISLEEADCYLKPAVTKEDENLKKEAEQLNKFTGLQVSLDFGSGQETITRDQLKAWLVKGEDGNYSFNEAAVKETVIAWSEKYNTYGKPRDFTTTGGAVVHLSGGDYGWRLWQDKTTESLVAALNAGQSGPVEPTWLYKGQEHGGDDINGTYVEISISQQRMWFYKNGTCLVDTPVVTGNPNLGNGTPAGGVWRLKDKASPFTLVGKNPDGSIEYEEPVNYWLPFNGGVGIHDLTKRTAFGGDIYLYNGSHGCINTPLDNVRVIYENIDVNTPIVVY